SPGTHHTHTHTHTRTYTHTHPVCLEAIQDAILITQRKQKENSQYRGCVSAIHSLCSSGPLWWKTHHSSALPSAHSLAHTQTHTHTQGQQGVSARLSTPRGKLI